MSRRSASGPRAKYRLLDGRQVQRTIGPAWTARGRPPRGFYTRRTAEAWLRDILGHARLGTLPGMVRTGQTFALVAEEYLDYLAHDRHPRVGETGSTGLSWRSRAPGPGSRLGRSSVSARTSSGQLSPKCRAQSWRVKLGTASQG